MKHYKKAIQEVLLEILRENSNEKDDKADKAKSEKEPKSPKGKKKSSSPPGSILTRGAFGSGGRPSKFALSAKARAEKDPAGLMRDLGIRDKASGNDKNKALSIINQSIHGNQVMSQAYMGATIKDAKTVDGSVVNSAIVITLRELDRKNGVRFMANTLEAAKRTGKLSLKGSLQFSQGAANSILLFPA